MKRIFGAVAQFRFVPVPVYTKNGKHNTRKNGVYFKMQFVTLKYAQGKRS